MSNPPTPTPEATPERAAMTDEHMASLRLYVKLAPDSAMLDAVRASLAELERLHAVIAERDREIARLYESIDRRNANLRAIYDIAEPGRYAGAMDASELAEQIRLAVNRGLLGQEAAPELAMRAERSEG